MARVLAMTYLLYNSEGEWSDKYDYIKTKITQVHFTQIYGKNCKAFSNKNYY